MHIGVAHSLAELLQGEGDRTKSVLIVSAYSLNYDLQLFASVEQRDANFLRSLLLLSYDAQLT